jgi:hypothetical protein
MKCLAAAILVLAVIGLSACGEAPADSPPATIPAPAVSAPAPDLIISVTITDNGISQNVGSLRIGNLHPGSRAVAAYQVLNQTAQVITPGVWLILATKPDDYSAISGQGYVSAPRSAGAWFKLPDTRTIAPGESAIYSVTLEIPESATGIPPKWAAKTLIAGNNGGFSQTGTELWWVVDMR